MSITLIPNKPSFVAEVQGLDLRKPVTAEQVATIERAMDEYAVLLFRDQPLNDQQQLAFSQNFGPIEKAIGNLVVKDQDRRLPVEFADVSNLGKDQKPLPRSDRNRLFNIANRLWHSDSSFRRVPAKYSLLSARSVADHGGDTEFADMRGAYDGLDASTREEIESYVCEHSLLYSRQLLGFTEWTDDELEQFRPVLQTLVRRHPETGRKSLFLSSHAGTIVGWPMPEARAYLRDLIEHATQPHYVYVHRWRVDDLVMWDNRQTMHRVRRFDDAQQRRDVRRVTIAGDCPTVETEEQIDVPRLAAVQNHTGGRRDEQMNRC